MKLVFPPANAPCKDCQDRHIGCHCECEKYKTFTEEYGQMTKDIRRKYEKEEDLNKYEIQRIKRIKERTGHK